MKKLLDKYTDKQILKRLIEIYPDQNRDAYIKVLQQLRKMKSSKTTMILYPNKYSTDAMDTKDNQRYAIEFIKWQEWLSMPVKTRRDGLTTLCYCLWEMTYMGFRQQPIQRKINELNKIAQKIKVDKN